MRTTFDLSLLLACCFASLAIWRSPPRLPSALDSVAATRITGRQTPPPCNTYYNTTQCAGDSASIYCVPGPSFPMGCQGDCTGYTCTGQNTVSYCSVDWIPPSSYNALDCTYKATTCGKQESALAGATCAPTLVDVGPGPFQIFCLCGETVVTNNDCADQTVDDSGVCDGPGIIAFFRPEKPDDSWQAGMRLRRTRCG